MRKRAASGTPPLLEGLHHNAGEEGNVLPGVRKVANALRFLVAIRSSPVVFRHFGLLLRSGLDTLGVGPSMDPLVLNHRE